MSADDFKGRPEDRDLYLRLLVERDGQPLKALAERDPGLTAPANRQQQAAPQHARPQKAVASNSAKRAAA
ncbi:hypothetical protein AB0I84_11050 [Streptomyces spectabilis]|uniref:hypothetical protein n=1 Tax=Streptomyces spectabilis TaxID=68270 RepID=UPI0033D872F7